VNLRKALRILVRRRHTAPRPWRPSWVPSWVKLQSERDAHPHVAEERAHLFLAYDAGSTEIEILNWLYATVCLVKPQHVLETGAFQGLGTLALASACRANGFGVVHAVEIDADLCALVTKRLAKARLSPFAQVYCADSREFLRKTSLCFEFAFFDSQVEIRAEEFRICREREALRGIAVFHDTSCQRTRSLDLYPDEATHRRYREDLMRLAREAGAGFFDFELSRGLFVIFPPRTPRLG
jgi:predicted O-methyltransferase YrrM